MCHNSAPAQRRPLPEDEAAEVAAPGDTVFTWGCLDWMSAATNAGKKENVRAALVAVHTPEILPPPEALRGKRIAQLASGGRHLLLVTTEGEAFAWGRGTSRCLGVIATGCAGAPSRCAHLRSAACRWRRWRAALSTRA